MSHPQTNCEIDVIKAETDKEKEVRIAAICQQMTTTLPLRIAELQKQRRDMTNLCSDMGAVTLNP